MVWKELEQDLQIYVKLVPVYFCNLRGLLRPSPQNSSLKPMNRNDENYRNISYENASNEVINEI